MIANGSCSWDAQLASSLVDTLTPEDAKAVLESKQLGSHDGRLVIRAYCGSDGRLVQNPFPLDEAKRLLNGVIGNNGKYELAVRLMGPGSGLSDADKLSIARSLDGLIAYSILTSGPVAEMSDRVITSLASRLGSSQEDELRIIKLIGLPVFQRVHKTTAHSLIMDLDLL